MMKKIGLSLLVLFILFGSFGLKVFADVTPYNKDHTKIVVRSLGEKMGIMWTDKSLNATVDYLTTKAYIEERDNHSNKQKAQMLSDWSNYIQETSFVDGVATAVVGPEKWYDGMRAIYEAMNELNVGENVDTYDPLGCVPEEVKTGGGVPPDAQYYAHFQMSEDSFVIYYFNTPVIVEKTSTNWRFETIDGSNLSYKSGSKSPYYPYYNNWFSPQPNWNNENRASWTKSSSSKYELISHGVVNGPASCPKEITEEEIINSSGVSQNIVKNLNFNGDTNITTNMPITYANTVVYDYSQPVNNPLTEDEIKDLFKEVLDEETPPEEPEEPEPPKPEPDDKPEGASWWEWLIKPIAGAITGLGKVLESVLGAITGLVEAIGDLLMSLVVPDGDVLTEQFGSVKDTFDNKIPIINQLNDFFGQVSESTINEVKPTFDVNIPEEWGGGTFPIIDFAIYDEYRDWVLNFIRFIAWFVFLKRLYNRIPRIIY